MDLSSLKERIKAITPKMRDYQIKSCKSFLSKGLKENKNGTFPKGMVVLPTGSGKTFTCVYTVAKALAEGRIRSCLWLAHRKELVDQAQESLEKLFPEIESSKWTAESKQIGLVTFASVQSCRTLHEAKADWDLIVVDECHHVSDADNSYTGLFDRLDPCPVLGLTATPYRLDAKDLVFTRTYHEVRAIELIKAGYLAKPVYLPFNTGQHYALDKRGSKTDFTSKSLRMLDNEDRNQALVDLMVQNAEKFGQMIVFAIDVENAENLLEMLEDQTDFRCALITGTTDSFNRDSIRSKMAAGAVDVVINVAVFTEGFDAPSVNTVIMARPTASKSLMIQMIGRGFRKAYDADGNCIKDSFNLVTVEDQIQTFHELIRCVLPEVSPEEEEKAKELQEQQERETALLGRLNAAMEECKELEPLKGIDRLSAVGSLRYSTYYKFGQGFLLTHDRLDCISRLRLYAGELQQKGEFSRDRLVQSFTQCVPSGEISRKNWENLVYGYWLCFFKHESTVTDKDEEHPTWSLVIDEELDQEPVMQESLDRARTSYSQMLSANTDFNKAWGGKPAQLYDKVIKHARKTASHKEKWTLDSFLGTVDHAKLDAHNRILTVYSSLSGGWGSDLQQLGVARRCLSAALEEVLDDSCSGVTVKLLK